MSGNANRDSDRRLLEWVKMRSSGVSCAMIGAAFGVTRQLVSMHTRAVREADIKHCGEEVSKYYW